MEWTKNYSKKKVCKVIITGFDKILYPTGLYIEDNIEPIQKLGRILIRQYTGKIILACSGSSGAIIADIISVMYRDSNPGNSIEIIHIKKEGECSHSSNSYSPKQDTPIIIVDDFISSGGTLRYIYKQLNKGSGYVVKISMVLITGHFAPKDLDFIPEIVVCSRSLDVFEDLPNMIRNKEVVVGGYYRDYLD